MSKESQNIEWKESWQNDYFKWICGFANAQGGISNSEVQTICKVSKATATRYLGELETEWIDKIGSTGVELCMFLKGSVRAQIMNK